MKIIKLNRIDYGTHLGGLMTLEDYSCYTLNHPFGTKIKPMPDGVWEVKERKVLSEMTIKWRAKCNWFEWFLMLQDVPNRDYLYIHSGNRLKQSKGCELVGEKANGAVVGESLSAMYRIYEKAYRILKSETLIIKIQTLR